MEYGSVEPEAIMLTCCVIGTTGLAVRCCELLLEKKYEIKLIVSDDEEVKNWALSQNIHLFPSFLGVEEQLKDYNIDFLFSIINPLFLSGGILNKPNILPINYHDSFLPKYAGLHATNWAILNGEKTHGVTWHVMTECLDKGDILKQNMIEIEPDETVFGLNLKCFEKSIASFTDLLVELRKSEYPRIKQNGLERKYFPLKKPLPDCGIIFWENDADRIFRLYRATFFEGRLNKFGSLKVLIKEEIFIVKKASIVNLLDCDREFISGTVVDTNAEYLIIAARDKYIKLEALSMLSGDDVNFGWIYDKWQLKKGEVLSFDNSKMNLWKEHYKKIKEKESFWASTLSLIYKTSSKASFMPFLKKKDIVKFSQIDIWLEQIEDNYELFTISVIFVYLLKINNYEKLSIWYRNSRIKNEKSFFYGLIADKLPVLLNFNEKNTFLEILRCSEKLKQLVSYEEDIIHRYQLENFKDSVNNILISVINEETFIDSYDETEEFFLIFYVDIKNKKIVVKRNEFQCSLNNDQIKECINHLSHSLLKDSTLSDIKMHFNTPKHWPINFLPFNARMHREPVINNSINSLFTEQVDLRPFKIALIYRERELSYQSLNEEANKVANFLLEKGLKVSDFVGVCMGRSEALVIGLLGVIKAGGVYVPLDPKYPKERLAFMLEDSGARFLVTETKYDRLFENFPGKVVKIEEILSEQKGIETPNIQLCGEDSAYVIYTSGSTGKPKGVLIPHRGVLRLVKDRNYDFNERDVIAQSVTQAFDIFTVEVWGALLNGGTCVVIPQEILLEPKLLADFYKEQKITVVLLTTGLFNTIIEVMPKAFYGVKTISVGGEVLNPEIINQVLEKDCKPERLLNCYGPTENTTTTTIYEISEAIEDGRSVPIGKPIWNTEVYILDRFLQCLPIGAVGELHVGGAGLAHGYLNREDLTKEKFILHPFRVDEKIYRTGDLVRFLESGDIEFIGRIDNQIKLRGYRIDPGEIENNLREIEGVNDAIVLLKEVEKKNKILVSFLEVDELPKELPQYQEKINSIKRALKFKLPHYMQPQAYRLLRKFPFSIHGKVDRKLLLSHTDQDLFCSAAGYVEPSDVVEKELALMCGELLGVSKVGVFDNFFELGGNSLLVIRLISLIQKSFNVSLSVKMVFDCISVRVLAKAIKALSGEKELRRISKIERDQDLKLSFAQQRLWAIEQLFLNKSLYHIPIVLHLEGNLKIDKLEKAFYSLIRRHETLRTVFKQREDGAVFQVAEDEVSFKLKQVQCKVNSVELMKRINCEAMRGFDLEKGPLMRACVYISEEKAHVLQLTLHHIIADEWSIKVLYHDIKTFYNSFVLGDEPCLEPLKIQYADFSLWQRSFLKGDRLEKQLKYWKDKLYELPTELRLPFDKERPKELTYLGGRFVRNIDKDVLLRLKGFRAGITEYMLWLALFQGFLHRYTGEEVVVVGSPIANRHYSDVDGLIGFFANTIVLDSYCRGNTHFIDLLSQVKKTVVAAQEHQDVPFEQVVDHCNVHRAFNKNPLFQAMFLYQEREGNLGLLDTQEKSILPDQVVSKFDMTMTVHKSTDSISIEYSQDLFFPQTIDRFFNYFIFFVNEVIKQPKLPIFKLPLITKEEQRMQLEWGSAEAFQFSGSSIHRLFEEQVIENFNKPALICGEQKFSYQKLNEEANKVANFLIDKGLKTGDFVGICLDRSEVLVIGILGIVKAGGVYMPLDAQYPKERLKFILKDSTAPFLLLGSRYDDFFQVFVGKKIIIEDILIEEKRIKNTKVEVKSEDIAYINYTSGSTGKPKGVLVSHKGVIRLVKDNKYLLFTKEDVVAQAATSSFDAFTLEVWGALLNGGTCVIVPQEILLEPALLGDFYKKQKVTVLWLTASWFNRVVEVAPKAFFKIQTVIVGGEVLSPNIINQVLQKDCRPVRLLNGYGPTENTTFTTMYEITKEIEKGKSIPIGRPIANTEVYILDSNLQLMPTGMVGELCVGGAGLACGYLNREDLTKEKFISHPFKVGEKIYRTGDLVRYLAGGKIAFIGRKDYQIKFRGYRIELGEIECNIKKIDGVKGVVVLIKETDECNKKLIAYLALEKIPKERGQYQRKAKMIGKYLAVNLPHYMQPQGYVFLERFPCNANGKINREALLAMKEEISVDSENRNIIKEKLLNIWRQVLGVEEINSDDNFFNLGGNSLLVPMVVKIAKDQGLIFKMRQLFECPCIEQLSWCVVLIDNSLKKSEKESTSDSEIAFLKTIDDKEKNRKEYFFEHVRKEMFKKDEHWNQLRKPVVIKDRGIDSLKMIENRVSGLENSSWKNVGQLIPSEEKGIILHQAVKNRDFCTVKSLWSDFWNKVSLEDKKIALCQAIEQESEEILIFLIECTQQEIFLQEYRASTMAGLVDAPVSVDIGVILCLTVWNEDLATMKLLLRRAKDKVSVEAMRSAFCLAAHRGNLIMVKFLLKQTGKKLSIEAKNKAFCFAAQYEHSSVVDFLLERIGLELSPEMLQNTFENHPVKWSSEVMPFLVRLCEAEESVETSSESDFSVENFNQFVSTSDRSSKRNVATMVCYSDMVHSSSEEGNNEDLKEKNKPFSKPTCGSW